MLLVGLRHHEHRSHRSSDWQQSRGSRTSALTEPPEIRAQSRFIATKVHPRVGANRSQKAIMKDKVRFIIGTLIPSPNANFLCVICPLGASHRCVRGRIKIVTISRDGPGTVIKLCACPSFCSGPLLISHSQFPHSLPVCLLRYEISCNWFVLGYVTSNLGGYEKMS